MRHKKPSTCAVFGAGALGLGFLGPELSPWLRVVFVDIPSKNDLLSHLAAAGKYRFNETGPAACIITVENISGMIIDDKPGIASLLDEADIVFTAVGEDNLKSLAPFFADSLDRRRQDNPLRIICSENGADIALKCRSHISALCGGEPEALITADAVMGRMCKIVAPVEKGLEPVGPGLNFAVAGEPLYGIPVPSYALAGMESPPPPLQPMTVSEFEAQEDIKMLAHNGLHAFLSFMGDARDGCRFFSDLPADRHLMEMAHRMLHEEVAPALMAIHRGVVDRNHLMNYLTTILRRITCRGLNDTIERGTRGVMRKLQPWERLVGSIRAIHDAGIKPVFYARGLAAAVQFAVNNNETGLSFEEVLTEECCFKPDSDRELISLIRHASGCIHGSS